MNLDTACTVRTLFEVSFGLIRERSYVQVFDEVFILTCTEYNISYQELFESELDRDNALTFIIIAVQIFEAIINRAELISYKINGMRTAGVVLRQIIKFCEQAEIDLFTQDEMIIIGQGNKFINVVIGSSLYETYIITGVLH